MTPLDFLEAENFNKPFIFEKYEPYQTLESITWKNDFHRIRSFEEK